MGRESQYLRYLHRKIKAYIYLSIELSCLHSAPQRVTISTSVDVVVFIELPCRQINIRPRVHANRNANSLEDKMLSSFPRSFFTCFGGVESSLLISWLEIENSVFEE